MFASGPLSSKPAAMAFIHVILRMSRLGKYKKRQREFHRKATRNRNVADLLFVRSRRLWPPKESGLCILNELYHSITL